MIFILLYSFMMYFYTTATFLKKYFQIFILAGANEKETVNWWCRLKTQKRGEKFEEFFAARNAFQLSEGNASLPLKQINKEVLVNRPVTREDAKTTHNFFLGLSLVLWNRPIIIYLVFQFVWKLGAPLQGSVILWIWGWIFSQKIWS